MNRKTILLLVFSFLCLCRTAASIGPDDPPHYMTDIHGAGGALRALLGIVDDYPQFEPYIEGTVNWLYNVRIETDAGVTWKNAVTLAPPGYPAHFGDWVCGVKSVYIAWLCAQVDQRKPNPRCRELVQKTLRFIETQELPVETRSGYGCQFPGRAGGKTASGAGAGYWNGKGAVVYMFSHLYELTGDRQWKKFSEGLLNVLKDEAIETVENGTPLAMWYWNKRGKVWHTGFCYGTAGNVWGLLKAAQVFPDHRFHDGTSPLELANAGLNWLASKAIREGEGLSWPNVRYVTPTENVGWGGGAGGIGGTFLRGYQVNKTNNPEVAGRYLEVARKTAVKIVTQLEGGWDYRGKTFASQTGKPMEYNLAWCGGVGGTGRFLVPFANEIEARDPELAKRCRNASRIVAQWFLDEALPFGDGVVWHARKQFGGKRAVNFALDYGMSGMTLSVHQLARELKDPKLDKLALDAAKGMVALGVREGDGIKWPLITPLPKQRGR